MSSLLIKDMPTEFRPRERLEHFGVDSLSDEALLAILLRNGRRGLSVTDLARELIYSFGSLGALASASWREIIAKKIPGVGPVKAKEIVAAIEFGRRVSSVAALKGEVRADDAERIFRILRPQLLGLRQEQVWVLLVSAKGTLIGTPKVVAKGSGWASDLDARSILEPAIRDGAAGVVVAHNHPGGIAEPSPEDLESTRKLQSAAKLMNIPLLDHLIVTELGYVSIGR